MFNKSLPTTSLAQFKNILLANALFSGLSGIILSVFYRQIAQMIGVSLPGLLLFTGIGLVLFAALLISLYYKAEISQWVAQLIIISDWSWVISSVLVLTIFPDVLTETGNWLVAIIALIVGYFAFAQQQAVNKI